MKKRFWAMAAAAAMVLSAAPVLSAAEEGTASLDPDWIPATFEEAMDFENTYGTTHIEDGVICLVFREYSPIAYSYEVTTTTDVASECFHEIYENETADFRYEVVMYKPFANGTFEVSLNSTYGDSTYVDASYDFYVDEKGDITETDLYAWVPDCITEYNDFIEQYGKVSIRENYIVYCAEVNGSTGASLIMEQNGTAEIKKILESDCSIPYIVPVGGNTAYFVEVYQPVSDGTVDVSWTVGREWELEESTVSDIEKSYEVSENGTSIREILSAPDDFTQRISVVDYDTNTLIHFDDHQEFMISFHTGYEVEFALTEGGFAWGTMWGPTSEWDYNAQNPYVIDISGIGTSGVSDYEVVDIDLPDGYFLPDDYLETVAYDNASTDIYIRLKKTISGDVNADGVFSVADVILFQKWLLAVPDTHLANWKAADFCEDGVLDVFDLSMMKRALTEEHKNEAKPMLVTIYEGFSWDQLQTVEVFDQYGNLYATDTVFGLDNFYRITSDTWYEGLCDIIRTHTAKPVLSAEMTDEVKQYVAHIDDHQTCTMSDPKGVSDDFGQEKLYVIYQDSEGKVSYQLLSNFGDMASWQECGDVQRIVMDMVDSGNYSYPNYYELLQS